MRLEVNRAETGEALRKGASRLSWTQFSQFEKCQQLYAVSNHVRWAEDSVGHTMRDDCAALPGSVVQRFMEAWVNDGLAARPFDSVEQRKMFIRSQVAALIDVMMFPLEKQFSLPGSGNPRYYFRTNEGKSRVQHAIQSGMSSVFRRGMKMQFVDTGGEQFVRRFQTVEKLTNHLTRCVERAIDGWHENQLVLSSCRSEVWTSGRMALSGATTLEVVGQVDFLVNPNLPNVAPVSLRDLQDQYVLFDGKYSFGPSLDRDQLMFYAVIIYLATRKFPKFMGFWNWSEAEFQWYPFTMPWFNNIVERIKRVSEGVVRAASIVETQHDAVIPLKNLYLTFGPSTNACRYCPIGVPRLCEAAREAKTLPQPIEIRNKEVH